MDEFYFQRSHVPAFGSWDCYDDLPFTQCFESARQAGLLRYSYSGERDLYVAGDLYENDILTPAMIVVPRSTPGKTGYPTKEKKKLGLVTVSVSWQARPERRLKLLMRTCTRFHLISSVNNPKGREDGVSFRAACGPHVFVE